MMQGKAEGKAEDVHAVLVARSEALPRELEERIHSERRPEELHRWVVAAAKEESLEAFRGEIAKR